MEVQAKISRICLERFISFLRSSFGLVLHFLSVSPLIWRAGVEKELVSTPVHFKFCFLLFVGTRFINHRPNCTVHFSYTQSRTCKKNKWHSSSHKRILFICSMLCGVESKEKQAMENKRKLTCRTLHVRDKASRWARELSSCTSYIRL